MGDISSYAIETFLRLRPSDEEAEKIKAERELARRGLPSHHATVDRATGEEMHKQKEFFAKLDSLRQESAKRFSSFSKVLRSFNLCKYPSFFK